jgi:hypothetical protein
VVAWCTNDSAKGTAVGNAYVDYQAVNYIRPNLPTEWSCLDSTTEPTIYCYFSQQFPKRLSKSAPRIIKLAQDRARDLLFNAGISAFAPFGVTATRWADRSVTVEVSSRINQTTAAYPEGRFTTRT